MRHGGRRSGTTWSRRELLAGAGTLVVGFSMGFDPSATAGQQPAAALPEPGRTLDPKAVDSFLVIHRNGSVTIYTSKVDVGTGMRIAMAQMAAEELGVSAARITIVDGDTARCPNHGGTGGSTG
ncbi:MAG: molybdopterin cofactor-binding domain-containing protein, partial [Vicinamibacterales bacterium]